MKFFEKELRTLFETSSIFTETRYVGRACFGTISKDLTAKIEFITVDSASVFSALRVAILNKKEGQVDVIRIHFADLFGQKKVSNTNFPAGINPHIWENGGDAEWYVYKLSFSDYAAISNAVENYVRVFADWEEARK